MAVRDHTVIFISAVALAGCATQSSDIAPTYVSPLQYQSYDCGQLTAEAQRIQARVAQVGGRLDQAASNDKAITGAGIILFWPALFFLDVTSVFTLPFSPRQALSWAFWVHTKPGNRIIS